jgi:hypothetical protein
MSIYNNDFYEDRYQRTKYSVDTILPIVRDIIPNINSVVDLGCGVGAWLYGFKKLGVEDVTGYDGPYVNKKYLKISEANFIDCDLTIPLKIVKRYDLAMSLEVAEHLPKDKAKIFIDSLTNLSDVVLFSAALPGPGGIGHVNCQWPEYWIKLFDQNGYKAFDLVRGAIWNEKGITNCYRNNAFIFIKEDKINFRLNKSVDYLNLNCLPLVHPELYEAKVHSIGIKESLSILKKAINRRFFGKKYNFLGEFNS